MNTNSVLILDFKGNVNSQKKDSRLRHETYAQKLSEASSAKPLRLIVISKGKNFKKEVSGNVSFFEVKSSRISVIGFISKSLRITKRENLKIAVLVCGDPWESFFLGKIFSRINRDKTKIQVQVHADISDKNWERNRLKNFIRTKLHNYAFSQADQVRAVSVRIADYVRLRNPNQNVFVTPIPINLEYRSDKSFFKHRDLIKIGFFGRLHKDRGTENFIDFIRKLDSCREDFSVVVAGRGSEEPRLKSELQKLLGLNRVIFLGYLEQPALWRSLNNLDIYFSLAPSESHGLGLRESVIAGVPVICLDSNGARDARELFGENSITIVGASISPKSLSQKIDSALDAAPNNDSYSIQLALNSGYLDTLIDSWLLLAESA
jgi:glycosyltransferase involved in cell wall biosynthesis